MFERFRWELTSGERYATPLGGLLCRSAESIAPASILSERVGVLAEYGGVVVRLPLGLRSLTLLRCFSRHSSLVLCSCLTLQTIAPKAHLTGKSKDKVAAKKTRKKPGGLACEGAGRSCMDGASRGLAFGAGHLRKTRLRLVGPPLLASKRRRACSSFDDRHNVSRKERSAGTQAVPAKRFG